MFVLVVDATVAVTVGLPDKAYDIAERAFHLARRNGVVVPMIWPMEVGNALATAVRRGRLTAEDVTRGVERLLVLAIYLSYTTTGYASHTLLQVALEHGLTSYDASYVNLSERRGLPLVIIERRMASAARAVGVTVYPPFPGDANDTTSSADPTDPRDSVQA